MNFRLHGKHSVILMSVRPNAPYADRVEEEGQVLVYEGHNENRTALCKYPELVDQPEFTRTGRPTENGKFKKAAWGYKSGAQPPERVRVYEKIKDGIWSYNGVFHLEDAWVEQAEKRNVFKFKLTAVEGEEDDAKPVPYDPNPGRMIPTAVKREVWKRDNGKCAQCGSKLNLHFDHIIPWSLGGSSTEVRNIQLLCSAHNLSKSDDIV
ncbi:MAG TPA: HNH endonuclease [Lacunisphaera sp.]|nr:HNH endonuclease [Lacunisphaera sp.]